MDGRTGRRRLTAVQTHAVTSTGQPRRRRCAEASRLPVHPDVPEVE
ncbi:MAG: hypothetical protein MZU95_09395 [Desulfomicrobium escambiense]|nr:hypothetical protein [Desulfomicrobium escambiense]